MGILTEADLDPVELYNAKVLAVVRETDPVADAAAVEVLSRTPSGGGQPLGELTLQLEMMARGYRTFPCVAVAANGRIDRPHCSMRISEATAGLDRSRKKVGSFLG